MEHRCPSCHASFSLETLAEDEALRELMALLAELPRETSRPLVLYIGLFRGKTRAPAYERQLRLAREVLALHADILLLGAALSETVEAIRAKRDSGEDNRPLKNHNYLKRVLESVQARGAIAPVTAAGAVPKSRTAQAIAVLQAHPTPAGVHPRFARDVCDGLASWLLLSLEGQPAADLINAVADKWICDLWAARDWADARYASRLKPAFAQAVKGAKRWPTIADVLSFIPRLGGQA